MNIIQPSGLKLYSVRSAYRLLQAQKGRWTVDDNGSLYMAENVASKSSTQGYKPHLESSLLLSSNQQW